MAADVIGVIRNATLTVATNDHSAYVHKARLVPDVNIQTYRTLVPTGVIQDVDSAVWTLELQGVQDYGTDGLARYLNDHHGESVAVVLTPKAGTGHRKATFSIIAHSVPFGGESGDWAEFDETFAVTGTITWADIP